jgi:hypothetical protein
MTTTLWRATVTETDATDVPVGSCWSPDRSTAESYLDNPGFGGGVLVSAEVKSVRVLDVRGNSARDLRPLAAAVGGDAQSWRDDGLDSVFAVLENRSSVARAVASMADWVVYLDDYPENATTWRRMA